MKPIAMLWALALLLAAPAQARDLPEFTWLVETYGPAVVNISTTAKKKDGDKIMRRFHKEIPGFPEDSPFNDFFRRFFDEGEGGDDGEEDDSDGEDGSDARPTSLGSGFILSADGYVVTNNHVIEDAAEIIVRLNDRREFSAKVIGMDERSDLAVLKVEAQDLPAVKLGSSDKLKVGAWVLAIGSPFGFEHSATAGIVSATGRSLPGKESNYVPFIQTDVAINPGNSGGPLFNLDGEVVGVNSQIYSRTGGFMGLSFSIPIDMAIKIIDQLKTNGKVSRGWLGVMIQDVNRELAESFGMKKPQGALIAKILPNGPAKDAGFQLGDIVIRFNGKEIDYSSELPPLVGTTPVGSKVDVQVIRQGKEITIPITIAELPGDDELKTSSKESGAPIKDNRLAVSVADLDEKARKALDVPEGGVVVEAVSDGPARTAGVRKGDVILMLDSNKIKDVAHFKEVVKALKPGQAAPLLVQRQGSPVFLALRVPGE